MSVGRPYWDGAGASAGRLRLKRFGTANIVANNNQVTTLTLTAPNVKAGGIVFAHAREPDNANVPPTPAGWTSLGGGTQNNRGQAVFFRLTPVSEAVTITFSTDKKISMWSMYLEDEKGRAHDIDECAAVSFGQSILTAGTTAIQTLNNAARNGDLIFTMACVDYSDSNAVFVSLTGGDSAEVVDTFPYTASGTWSVWARHLQVGDDLAETGGHTWTVSGILSGRTTYLAAASFRLKARAGSVPIDPPTPAVEKPGLALAGTFEQVTNVSGAVAKVTRVGNPQGDRHVVVVIYGNGQASDPPYPTLTCLNTGEQFTGLTKVWLGNVEVACWVMALKNADLDFMNLQLTPPAGTPPWRFLCRVFSLYGWDEVAHALTPATTTRDDDIWIDTGAITEPGTALIAAVVGTSGTFFTIDNTEIVQNSILQGEGRLVVGVRNTPDPFPGGNVRAQMQCGASNQMMCGMRFDCSDYTPPPPDGDWSPADLFKNGENGFWLDLTDATKLSASNAGTGTVTAGGLVGRARTSAGRIIDFNSPADDASRPVYDAKTGMVFEGGQLLKALNVPAIAYQFLLVVMRSRDSANSRRILSFGNVHDYENANQLAFHQDAGKIDWWRNGTRATYPRPTEMVAVEVRPEGTAEPRNVDLYVNNVVGTRVAQEELRDLYGPNVAVGGSTSFDTGLCFIGEIAELIILDRALTTQERTELTDYIRNKHGEPPAPAWTPAELFKNGETGFWLDPMDTSKMFASIAGTGAVAVGDRVGSWRTSGGIDVLFTAPGDDNTRPILRDKALEYSRADGTMMRGIFTGWKHGYIGVIWRVDAMEDADPRFLSCGRPGEPDYSVDERFTFNTKSVESGDPGIKQEFLSNYRAAILWWPYSFFGQWNFGEVRHVGGQDVTAYRNYLWAGNTILPVASPAEWTSITMGARNPGEEMMTGLIGEVIMRKEPLTADELTALQLYIDDRYGPLPVPSGTEMYPTFKDDGDEP